MHSDDYRVDVPDAGVGVKGVARAFTWWAAKNESLEARQVLAGLGHLGDFLKAVSSSDIDLELGHASDVNDTGMPITINLF